ncbi:MAG: hypothetical protein AAF657_06490 [Acidobacteriota bacterium]
MLNTPFVVSFFSVVIVGLAGWAYSGWNDRQKEVERILQLKWEVDYRLRQLQEEVFLGADTDGCKILRAFLVAPQSLGSGKQATVAADARPRPAEQSSGEGSAENFWALPRTGIRPDDVLLFEALRGRSLRSILWDLELARYGDVESQPSRFELEGGESSWTTYTMRSCAESRPEAAIFCEVDKLDVRCRVFDDDEPPVSRTSFLKALESVFMQMSKIPDGL